MGDEFSEPKTIQCIASDHSISQVKQAARLAQRLVKTHPQEKIALVLGDETYLVPTLSGFDQNSMLGTSQWDTACCKHLPQI